MASEAEAAERTVAAGPRATTRGRRLEALAAAGGLGSN